MEYSRVPKKNKGKNEGTTDKKNGGKDVVGKAKEEKSEKVEKITKECGPGATKTETGASFSSEDSVIAPLTEDNLSILDDIRAKNVAAEHMAAQEEKNKVGSRLEKLKAIFLSFF